MSGKKRGFFFIFANFIMILQFLCFRNPGRRPQDYQITKTAIHIHNLFKLNKNWPIFHNYHSFSDLAILWPDRKAYVIHFSSKTMNYLYIFIKVVFVHIYKIVGPLLIVLRKKFMNKKNSTIQPWQPWQKVLQINLTMTSTELNSKLYNEFKIS